MMSEEFISEIANSAFGVVCCLFLDSIKLLKGTAKGTGDPLNSRSVPRSFQKELVPVQFLKKGTSSRNERSFGQFL